MTTTILTVNNLSKVYKMPTFDVHALTDIDFHIQSGEFVGLIGPSGSGKTTLINSLSGLLKPTTGHIVINGVDIASLTSKEIREFRLTNIGLVFQEHLLIESLSALENVELPLIFLGENEESRKAKALQRLHELGLEDKKDHLPSELSGGEQQRIGIARALICNPQLLLADEPTGDLDTKNSQIIMQLFKTIAEKRGTSIIMVSHNPSHRSKFDRVLELQDGKILN